MPRRDASMSPVSANGSNAPLSPLPSPGNATNAQAAGTRSILAIFQKYEKERLSFAQTIADVSARDANISVLAGAGVLLLLKGLLSDNVPGIRQAAAVALGRVANHSEELAEEVVKCGLVHELVTNLKDQNRFYKKAAAFVLRAVARHTAALAQDVVDAGGLKVLCHCLEEFDPQVKEASAWGIGYIARHSPELAQAVVNSEALPLLVLCMQEPELTLKRVAASALSDVAKHSPELAQAVVDVRAIPFLTQLMTTQDAKCKRQILSALSQIAKHTIDLAEAIVDAQVFPAILSTLHDVSDAWVRRQGATFVCEVVKHSTELAQLVVNAGGVAAIVNYTAQAQGQAKLPGIMTLGYIAAFSETLAAAVAMGKAIPILANDMRDEKDEMVEAACAWSLGQIGRHSPEHAKLCCENGVLVIMLNVMMTAQDDEAGQDLKMKTRKSLKLVIEKTLSLEALEPLVQLSTPPSIFKYVVAQFAKILPQDVNGRRQFVTSGALQRMQEFFFALKKATENYAKDQKAMASTSNDQSSPPTTANAENDSIATADAQYGPGSKLWDSIRTINKCFPEEIVRYYSPGYSSTLLDKIDAYSKQQDGNNTNSAGVSNQAYLLDPLGGNTGSNDALNGARRQATKNRSGKNLPVLEKERDSLSTN